MHDELTHVLTSVLGAVPPFDVMSGLQADSTRKSPFSRLESQAEMTTYYLKLYFCMLLAFFAIDMVWLVLVARGFYQKHLGFLLRTDPVWPAAIVFYLLFVFGLLVFVVLPSLEAGSTKKALALGALFGLITYATYDLTNLATVKNWPWVVTVVDLLWGATLAASVSYLGILAGKWLR